MHEGGNVMIGAGFRKGVCGGLPRSAWITANTCKTFALQICQELTFVKAEFILKLMNLSVFFNKQCRDYPKLA